MFDWSLNPYMGCVHRCTFCYVRAFERRADRPSDDRYGTSIRVKVNVADVLRRELARPSWARECVAIGAATDPYQPAEGRYRLTRACIEALGEARTPFSIITRGPMIVRDVDVLVEAARRASVSVTFSIPTLDEDVWRKTEPSTAHPRQRLRAVAKLVDAGIRTGVGMAPVLPGHLRSPRAAARGRDRPRARPAQPASGRTCSSCAPARASTSSSTSPRTGPSSCPATASCTETAPISRPTRRSPCARRVSALARELGVADRRIRPAEPAREPEQLALGV